MNWTRRLIRQRLLPLLLVLLVAVAAVGCQSAFQPHRSAFEQREWNDIADEDMQYLLGMYDHELLMSWVQELTDESYGGREAGTEYEDLAGDFIVEQLQSFGLQPWQAAGLDDYRHVFDLPGDTQPSENIIAVLPGESDQDFLLIGAHYDHIGVINGVYHPGADDNAVGTAAVLELARIFSASELVPEVSIVFVLFSGEEKGLIGSRALVDYLRQQELHDQVALLNLDVIAGVSGDTVVVFDGGFRGNEQWSRRAEQEARTTGIKAEISDRLPGGVDSMRFTERDIPGITLVWGNLLSEHPYLHQPTDTYENLNPDIVAAATKAAIRIAWAFAMK